MIGGKGKMSAAGSGSAISLSAVTYSGVNRTTNTSDLSVPISASAAEGDLLIALVRARFQYSDSNCVSPSGFTDLVNSQYATPGGTFYVRDCLTTKVLGPSDPGTGPLFTGDDLSALLVFTLIVRPSVPATFAVVGSVGYEGTNGNPTQQTVPVASTTEKSGIAIAAWCPEGGTQMATATSSISLTTFAAANEATEVDLHRMGFKIFNEADAKSNFTVDLGDPGDSNSLFSCYLEAS